MLHWLAVLKRTLGCVLQEQQPALYEVVGDKLQRGARGGLDAIYGEAAVEGAKALVHGHAAHAVPVARVHRGVPGRAAELHAPAHRVQRVGYALARPHHGQVQNYSKVMNM